MSIEGFRFVATSAAIKSAESTRLDLAAIVADAPCPAAAVVTKNRVRAAPAELCHKRARRGVAQAALVNSGNANAATGAQGMADAQRCSQLFSRAFEVNGAHVLPCSTGVIGVPLPMARIEPAIAQLAHTKTKSVRAFSEAILTTDKGPKVARANFSLRGKDYRVLAVAKGAGMIHPNMATTLAFVMTDAPVAPAHLKQVLAESSDATFNRISVDGDTSTNDTIIAFASPNTRGVSGERAPIDSPRLLDAFSACLGKVAEMIVADGEGAEHVAKIIVRGAKTNSDARRIAETIATSNLVKTAMAGKDPNWGRIAGAAGRAGVRFDQHELSIAIGGHLVFERGQNRMSAAVEKRASKVMARKKYEIEVCVGDGPGEDHYLTCDLGHAYVTVNADYRT